jgi:hypothetical protein
MWWVALAINCYRPAELSGRRVKATLGEHSTYNSAEFIHHTGNRYTGSGAFVSGSRTRTRTSEIITSYRGFRFRFHQLNMRQLIVVKFVEYTVLAAVVICRTDVGFYRTGNSGHLYHGLL